MHAAGCLFILSAIGLILRYLTGVCCLALRQHSSEGTISRLAYSRQGSENNGYVVHMMHHSESAAAVILGHLQYAGNVPTAPEAKDAGRGPQKLGQAVKSDTGPEAFERTPEPEVATERTPQPEEAPKRTPEPQEATKQTLKPGDTKQTAAEPGEAGTRAEASNDDEEQVQKEDMPGAVDPAEETKESWHAV